MSSRIIFAVMILVVIGVLFFKPKGAPPVVIEEEEKTVETAKERENAEAKLLADKNVAATIIGNSNESDLPKSPVVQTVAPSPTTGAEAPLTAEATEENKALISADSTIKKQNENKIKSVFRLPKSIKLNPQQEKLIEAIEKKYTPQMEEQLNKIESILSEEQKNARNEAMVKSVFDGDRPDVKYEVIKNATNMTGEQEQQQREVNREFFKLRNTARQEMERSLNPTQKTKLPPNWTIGRRPGRN